MQLGCVSQDSYPRKIILRESGKLGWKHTVKFSRGTWHQIKIRERKGPEVLSKSVRLLSVVFARRNSRKDHMRGLCTEKDAPAQQRGIWRKTFTKLKNSDKTMFDVPDEVKATNKPPGDWVRNP